MGAQIEGAGTATITIDGVDRLHPTSHRTVGDRVVGGTWAYAAAITQGSVRVEGVDPAFLTAPLERLSSAGAQIETEPDAVRVTMAQRAKAVDFITMPYPGFPTDLQPMALALAAVADGHSLITENVFEARFRFVDELIRMGADARTDGHHASLRGREQLSSGLVLAGLAADGVTEVHEVFHIDRGYPHFVEDMTALGGRIQRVDSADES
jgi:UDP-N-acetylglucosamine 1-carboxyvinyltransferase